MTLELTHIAAARRGLKSTAGPLDYAIADIRAQLFERLQQQLEHRAGTAADLLVIDFLNAQAAPRRYFSAWPQLRIESLSLLESQLTQFAQLPASRFDAVVLNLQLAWCDHAVILQQCAQVLKTDGVVLFSSLGPDTLHQLAQAWQQVDAAHHVHGFTDLHHLGDYLVKLGFKQSIVDADWLLLEYAGAVEFCRELKQEGFHNVLPQRRKSLTGKHRFRRFIAALQQISTQQAQTAVTLEVIYGYAKKAAPPSAAVRVAPPQQQ